MLYFSRGVKEFGSVKNKQFIAGKLLVNFIPGKNSKWNRRFGQNLLGILQEANTIFIMSSRVCQRDYLSIHHWLKKVCIYFRGQQGRAARFFRMVSGGASRMFFNWTPYNTIHTSVISAKCKRGSLKICLMIRKWLSTGSLLSKMLTENTWTIRPPFWIVGCPSWKILWGGWLQRKENS